MSKIKEVKVVAESADQAPRTPTTGTVVTNENTNIEQTVANIAVGKFKNIKITLTIYIEPPEVDDDY